MRYDAEHKQRTRQKVLREAANAIRAEGPDRIGVAALMAKAGLTHGGFYAHFESKDDLVAQAVTQMFDDRYRNYFEKLEGLPPPERLERFIDGYLSARHRDGPERGCPIPTLSGELARMPALARQRFAEGSDRMEKAIEAILKDVGVESPRDMASSIIAEMVGTIAIARVLGDTTKSNRMLKASRDAIKARIAASRAAH
jgi:TetR/AcrR family transcriptional regulator, transcriptional repressor for nem operon